MRCHELVHTLFLWAMLCMAPGLQAQKTVEHDLKITFTTDVTAAQVKFVHEGIRAQDPDPLVWMDIGAHHALVRSLVAIDHDELQAAIAPSGLVIARIREIGSGAPMLKSSDGNEAMPEFVGTGDQAMDDLRYELAKKAWVEEHPQHDHQLTAPAVK
jgi:hypothetical protein